MSLSRRHILATTLALASLSAPALAQNKIKVAGIYTVPVEQQWVSRIDKALKAAVTRGEIEYVFSENVTAADYERVLRQYAEKGNTLIVGEAFAVEIAARKVAKDYPKVSFLLGSSGKPQEPNFSVFDNYIHEPAYLSGMVAGGMTKSNKIGMVGGFAVPEVNRLMNAFMAGAREVKAKEAAFAMIDKGADVMYAERFGVSDAAKERKVLAIGNVINTQKEYPDTVVASAIWNMEPSVNAALAAVKAGKFKAEDYGHLSFMKAKGSELSPLGTFEKKVPAALVTKVKAKEKAILDGSFKVVIDDTVPKAK
jgi:basic membrane lipoprotein Med (substrate-binding protein (PBP1-ABC) superfamily)